MFDSVSGLYNSFPDKCFDEYHDLEKESKEELGYKFKPINLKIKGYDDSKLYNELSNKDYDCQDDYDD